MAIQDIKQVPPSPHSGDMPTNFYNPLDVEFVFYHSGQPHTVPAKTGVLLPEYLAWHGAKHLAEKIVAERWSIELKQKAIDIPADMKHAYMLHPIPQEQIRQMRDAILTGKEAFSGVVAPDTGLPTLVEEPPKEPPVEVPPVAEPPKEEPEIPDYDSMSWQDLRRVAKEKGIFDKRMKKADVIAALKVRL